MKFQNSSIHGFKVMLCIKKHDERTDGRMDGRTDRRTNNPEAICPSNFFEVGGIKILTATEAIKLLRASAIHSLDWPQSPVTIFPLIILFDNPLK